MNGIQQAPPAEELYCSFRVDEHWFAVPAALVREVHVQPPITPTPGAPRTVAGYVNLRGHLFLVLNANELLLGRSGDVHDEAYLVVFKAAAGDSFALRTGPMGEMRTIRRDDIDLPVAPLVGERHATPHEDVRAYLIGHAKLDSALMTLIEPRKLLSAAFDA